MAEIIATDTPLLEPDPQAGRPVAGMLLAGRYRLHRPIANGVACTVWIADDAILARPVAVKVLAAHLGTHPDRRTEFLERARLTTRVEHPAIATTFDSGVSPCVFTVGELVEGSRLEGFAVAEAPMGLARAVRIVMQLAAPLEALDQHRILHGGIDLDDILIGAHDALTVTALRCGPADGNPDATRAAAVETIGTVLYTLACGRPPDELALRARQVRADVTRELDDLTTRALEGRFESVAELRRELGRLEFTDERVASPVHDGRSARTRSRSRHDVMLVIGVLAVALVSVLIGVLASESGRRAIGQVVPGGSDSDRAAGTTTTVDIAASLAESATEAGAIDLDGFEGQQTPAQTPPTVEVTPIGADDFDPMGDGSEKPDLVPLAVDDDATTAWRSDLYKNVLLGGLKDGVGLIVEIPDGVTVTALQISSPGNGWSALVHGVTTRPRPSNYLGWGQPIAIITSGTRPDTIATLDAPQTGGHLLIWFTSLHESAEPDRYTITVSEIVLLAVAE